MSRVVFNPQNFNFENHNVVQFLNMVDKDGFSSADLEHRTRSSVEPEPRMRSRFGSCGSSAASPELEEQQDSLERQLSTELELKLQKRRESEQRKLSAEFGELNEEEGNLQLSEKRQLRSFSRADEYLYAMKEDLAEWLNLLYPWIQIRADTFMDSLQTGEHLLRVG